jgi:TPR repeat protein
MVWIVSLFTRDLRCYCRGGFIGLFLGLALTSVRALAFAAPQTAPEITSTQAFQRDLQAANSGDAAAQMRTARAYFEGKGVLRNRAEAAKRFQSLYQDGSVEAGAWLGGTYLFGAGVGQDLTRATELIKAAANAGDPVGLRFLGFMYATGRGVEQDFRRASALYQQAAAKGDPNACDRLGSLYLSGIGAPQSLVKAFEFFSEGARLGDSWAQLHLGELYFSGHTPPPASQGNSTAGTRLDAAAVAQNSLPDYVMAARLFRDSAAQGNRIAAFKLAKMYEAGQGVPQDYKMAFDYYKVSAKSQYVPALLALGEAHESGLGTEINLTHAYVAYALAAELNSAVAVQKQRAVVRRLGPLQLDDARKLLQQFKAQTAPE